MDFDLHVVALQKDYLERVHNGSLSLDRAGFTAYVDGVCQTALSALESRGASSVQKRQSMESLMAISVVEERLPRDFPILRR